MPFQPIARLHELDEGFRRIVRIGGRDYLFLHSEGQSHLVDRFCPHAGAGLERAVIDGGVLTCPRHGLRFSLQTGEAQGGGCEARLGCYPLSYDGNRIGVDVPGG
jgi:nitrite reductase/ring-hydroxylating ferredoxin subunit